MELRELIILFRRQARLFFGIVLCFIVLTFIWQRTQQPVMQATLLLNVGRQGVQSTPDYTYDSFYRLQADERFADTVVRWLASPRVVEDIYSDAHLRTQDFSFRDLKKVFAAGRLSSQMIEVTYGGPNEKMVRDLATSLPIVLNRYTESLNQEGQEKSWFVVIGDEPVVRDGRTGLPIALGVALAVGMFVAFWTVLLRHYFAKP